MKKLVLMLAVAFSVSLFSCGNGETKEAADSAAADSTAAVVEETATVVEEVAPADTVAPADSVAAEQA
ncbi:MAG: hypothetical protein K2I56_03710 [Muribaculaceae bacterium]|nr:hypothetical protein [Muribaculaceae bacterium]